MRVKFFRLGKKDPERTSRGRRYYALYSTRAVDLPVDHRADALVQAQSIATPEEVAVALGDYFPVPIPGRDSGRLAEVLRKAYEGKAGYINDHMLLPTLWLTMPDGQRVAATSCHWLALPNGAVCEYAGQMYQVCASNALMPVNL